MFVLSGPLYIPEKKFSAEDDPDKGISRFRSPSERKYIMYEVLGNGVHVPTHLYKVVVVNRNDMVCASAFIVKNGPQVL